MRDSVKSERLIVAANQKEKEKEYWLKKLSGELIKSIFPYDYKKDSAPHTRADENKPVDRMDKPTYASIAFKFSGELFANLMAISKGSDYTLNIVLQALLIALLGKITGRHDIIIGAPTFKYDVEGDHINSVLALRNQMAEGLTFKQLLIQVRQTVIEATENQNYPVEVLAEQVAPPTPSSSFYQGDDFPLFDISILIHGIHDKKYLQHINHNMIFSFLKTGEYVDGTVEYNPVRYDRHTVERIVHHFSQLLREALINLEVAVSDLEILTQEEKKQLLQDFNGTALDYPCHHTLSQLFEQQVGKTPNKPALVFEDRRLKYKELNDRANQVAKVLRAKALEPGAIVGIMLEPSLEMIVAVFGVLKAGGAYLPLEPGYPESRNAFMLRDCAAGTIIIHQPLLDRNKRIRELFSRDHILAIDEDFFTEKVTYRAPDVKGKPENPACIIYNSGPSGEPGGVIVEHRNAVNLIYGLKERVYKHYHNETETLRFCLLSPFISGASLQHLLGAPLLGHTLYIVSPADKADGLRLTRFYQKHQIDISDGTPSHLRLLVECGEDNHWNIDVKHFIIGGDILPPEKVAAFYNRFKSSQENGALGKTCPKITNVYGMSEGCVDSTSYEVSRDGIKANEDIPIGKPLPNQQVYILNRKNRLQPLGSEGELHIGGAGVVRGYLNKPELTEEKFNKVVIKASSLLIGSSKKLSKSTNNRLYKTGDRARWLADGNLEFLGRLDRQVKIKGYRTELKEIETQLLKHDKIEDAVVLAREIPGRAPGEHQGKYLCAYIAPTPPGTSDRIDNSAALAQELRRVLSQALPGYMIPSHIVCLEKLPRNAEGQIKPNELPPAQEPGAGKSIPYVPPGNEIEKKLVEIWEKVLNRKKIGINEDFLVIGGDSIKSIQVASRLNKAGYKVDIRDILRFPTIAQLAPKVENRQRIADQAIVTGRVPLTPRQKRFFETCTVDPHHYNQAVMLSSQERLDEEAVKSIFKKIQEHHDALRLSYKIENGDIVQTIQGLDYPFSLQVIDFRGRDNIADAIQINANQLQASIDLAKGPLMKVGLFRLDDGDRLLIIIHHLAVDGISWRILFEDLETLFQQYKKGEPYFLPLKSDSFKFWSEKLSQYAGSQAFLKEQNYWLQMESTVVPRFQKDFPEVKNDRRDIHRQSFRLGEAETELLLTKVNEAFATEINDILLTALGLAVYKTFGHNRLLIMLEGHGREEILENVDISRTIGWFTSIFPILVDLSYATVLSRQIREVKETLRQLPNGGIGYGIWKYLTPKKHKTGSGFKLNPQIIFGYWGQFEADLEHMSFAIASETGGDSVSIDGQREYEFEVSGIITDKRLQISITYNKKQYKANTIKTFLSHFKAGLSRIISYCSTQEKKVFTPSDLTYKGLSPEILDRLTAQYNIEDIYALTPMQEGMLFHTLYENGSSVYFDQLSYRFQGKMEPSSIEKSLNELLKRHEVLRTLFVYDRVDQPLQVVLQDRQVDFYFEDIQRLSAEEKVAFIREFKEKDRQQSFDLNKDVLMRIMIFRLDEAEYEFIWSHHHILMDGWCFGILIAEFFEIYNSFLENRPYRLAAVKPYREYSEWLQKRDKQKSRSYWQGYLKDYDHPVGIPKKKGFNIGEPGYKKESIRFALEHDKTRELKQLAARNGVTMNTVIQTIWGVLLALYNGRQDVVFGAVVSGRPSEINGVERMVGLFINTIPIRIRYEGDIKFIELLKRVREEAIKSEGHHYFPLVEIQAESILKQNLLDHIMDFHSLPIAEQIDGLMAGSRENKEGNSLKLLDVEIFWQSNYDLNVLIYFYEQLEIELAYNDRVYDGKALKKIADHIRMIVEQILKNQKVAISELTLLSEKERTVLIKELRDKNETLEIHDSDINQDGVGMMDAEFNF